jgi:hypothetical protein
MPRVIVFDNYRYVDLYSKDNEYVNVMELAPEEREKYKQYTFNQDEYNKSIRNGRELEANKYASKFHFNDAAKDREYRAHLNQHRTNAEIYDAIYQNAQKQGGKQYEAMRFIDDYEQRPFVRNSNDEVVNGFSREWLNGFSELGSANTYDQQKDGQGDKYASRLKLTFMKKHRGGKSWFFDGLVRDNQNTVDQFITDLSARTGYNTEELKGMGIAIEAQGDGSGTVSFNKDIDEMLARDIIYVMSHNDHQGFDNRTLITGYNSKGEELDNTTYNVWGMGKGIYGTVKNFFQRPWFFRSQRLSDGDIAGTIFGANQDSMILANMKDIVDYAEGQRDKFFNVSSEKEQLMQSWVGAALPNTKEDGYIKTQVANNILGTSGISINQAMYATKDWEQNQNTKKEDNDYLPLAELSNNQRTQMYSLLRNALRENLNNVVIRSMYIDGKEGVLFNFTPKTDTSDDDKNNIELYKKPLEVFIEGIDVMGQPIDDSLNTYINATKSVNIMNAYNSTHTLNDGTILSPNGDGSFSLYTENNGNKEILSNWISGDDAKNLINIDYISDDAIHGLYEKFRTIDDYNANANQFEELVQITSINGVNEMYQHLPILKPDGETPYTTEELVSMMNDDGELQEQYRNQFDERTYNKILMFYRLYNQLSAVRKLYR